MKDAEGSACQARLGTVDCGRCLEAGTPVSTLSTQTSSNLNGKYPLHRVGALSVHPAFFLECFRSPCLSILFWFFRLCCPRFSPPSSNHAIRSNTMSVPSSPNQAPGEIILSPITPTTRTVAIIKHHALQYRFEIELRISDAGFEVSLAPLIPRTSERLTRRRL